MRVVVLLGAVLAPAVLCAEGDTPDVNTQPLFFPVVLSEASQVRLRWYEWQDAEHTATRCVMAQRSGCASCR